VNRPPAVQPRRPERVKVPHSCHLAFDREAPLLSPSRNGRGAGASLKRLGQRRLVLGVHLFPGDSAGASLKRHGDSHAITW
jgi:hypothetical protein